jgi:hypothetical protein
MLIVAPMTRRSDATREHLDFAQVYCLMGANIESGPLWQGR